MENQVRKEKPKKENHKQRAYLNSITSILDNVVKQLTGFIVSPFIVKGLGDSLYGVYHILLDTTSYTNMADIRTSQVLKWTLAQKRDVLNDEELQSEFTTGFVLTLFLIPIVLLIGAILSWYAPIIANVSEEYYTIVRIASAIMVFSVSLFKIMDLFESVLRGMNLGFKGMGMRSILLVLGGGLKVFSITFGYGLVGLAVVQVIIAVITGLVFYWLVKRSVPWFGFGKTSKTKLLSYGKLSGWFMGTMLANTVLYHSEKVVLGFIAGPELVTIYVLTLFTSTAMKSMVDSVISGVVPGIGNFFGKKEFEKIKVSRKTIFLLIWWSTFSIGIPVLIFNNSFLGLWVGEGKYAGNIENLLIILISIQYTFYFTSGTFINVTLDLKRKVTLSGLAALTTTIIAFILVPQFKIIGLCISILLGRLFLSIGLPMFLRSKINDDSQVLTIENLRPAFITLAGLVLGSFCQEYIIIESWIYLIIIGIIIAPILGIIYWFLGFSKNQKNLLLENISKIKFLKFKG
jgi:O-antigen/teichoic acid export membrane protein